jgi:hypothetical protein
LRKSEKSESPILDLTPLPSPNQKPIQTSFHPTKRTVTKKEMMMTEKTQPEAKPEKTEEKAPEQKKYDGGEIPRENAEKKD